MKYKIIKYLSLLYLALLVSWTVIPPQAEAQCPMCRMSAEADLRNGGTKAKGLNSGIIYMLVMPYLILGTIGYVWYSNRRAIKFQEQQEGIRALLEPHKG